MVRGSRLEARGGSRQGLFVRSGLPVVSRYEGERSNVKVGWSVLLGPRHEVRG
jgi:hypothetical protein